MSKVQGLGGARWTCEGQGGFTLLESLIAMTVLAIGLLGLAGMQTIALSYNVMMERIHYNRRNVTAYNAIDTMSAGNPCPNAPFGGTLPTARGDCLQWQNDLDNSGLDNIQGSVVVTNPFGPAALNQSQVSVSVTWSTKRGEKKVARAASVILRTVTTPP